MQILEQISLSRQYKMMVKVICIHVMSSHFQKKKKWVQYIQDLNTRAKETCFCLLCWDLLGHQMHWLIISVPHFLQVCGFFFGAFLYTSDITSRSKSRTMGVSILEGLKGLLSAGINAVTGQLIQRTGFVVPSMMTVGCVLLRCWYILVRLIVQINYC